MDAHSWQSMLSDRILEPLNAPLRQIVRRRRPVESGSVVVDAACGTGTPLPEYHQAGCTVIDTDTSSATLTRARDLLGPDADLRQITSDRLPVADATADTPARRRDPCLWPSPHHC